MGILFQELIISIFWGEKVAGNAYYKGIEGWKMDDLEGILMD